MNRKSEESSSIMGVIENGIDEGVRTKLTIIARNAVPVREAGFPSIWMVNSVDQTMRVDVMRDQDSRPHVEEKRRMGGGRDSAA
jgi:hypothetical protein